MPDQAPPAAAGCVYGPWWDDEAQRWYYACQTPGGQVVCRIQLGYRGDWSRVWGDGWSFKELLRLAKENADLRASQPSEEDRAVLWLMKEKGWEMARSARGVWSMDGTPINSPTEEAKKLGWGG